MRSYWLGTAALMLMLGMNITAGVFLMFAALSS